LGVEIAVDQTSTRCAGAEMLARSPLRRPTGAVRVAVIAEAIPHKRGGSPASVDQDIPAEYTVAGDLILAFSAQPGRSTAQRIF
jgi:hypothetical protein